MVFIPVGQCNYILAHDLISVASCRNSPRINMGIKRCSVHFTTICPTLRHLLLLLVFPTPHLELFAIWPRMWNMLMWLPNHKVQSTKYKVLLDILGYCHIVFVLADKCNYI